MKLDFGYMITSSLKREDQYFLNLLCRCSYRFHWKRCLKKKALLMLEKKTTSCSCTKNYCFPTLRWWKKTSLNIFRPIFIVLWFFLRLLKTFLPANFRTFGSIVLDEWIRKLVAVVPYFFCYRTLSRAKFLVAYSRYLFRPGGELVKKFIMLRVFIDDCSSFWGKV